MSSDSMVSVNISSMCIASDIAIAEYNQVELSKLEAWSANKIWSLKRLAELPERLGLRCE